jgi:hypothetical protein
VSGSAALATDGVFEAVGRALADLYVLYGMFFLLLGAFVLFHGLVLLYLMLAAWRPRLRLAVLVLLAEVLYGLANPLVYLVVIERLSAFPRQWGLSLAGSTLLVSIWGSRLVLGSARFRQSRAARVYVRGLAIAALACVLAFVVKDVASTATGMAAPLRAAGIWKLSITDVWGAGALLSIGALYVIPAVLALSHLRSTASERTWGEGRRFFLTPPWLGWAVMGLVILPLPLATYHPAAARVELLVLRHRGEIMEAARHHAVDPALIASIVYVTHRHLTTPFADRLERAAMAAWMEDPKNNFLLTEPLDVSVGIAQVKPLTAMAALVIRAAPGVPPQGENLVRATASRHYKEYRGVPALGSRWRLPPAAVEALDSPFPGPLPKREVVEALFDDRRNLEMCALILALYAAQWEAANPAWSIRHRPEILATLYQIGFERSHPKPDPRPNRFGERVAEVYRSGFVQRAFGPPGARPA